MTRPSMRRRLGDLRRNLLIPLDLRASLAEFRALLPPGPSGPALWSVTQRYVGRGWFRGLSAWQVQEEYCRLVDLVAARRPRVILEIGTCAGGTLLAWSRIASQLVVSIDLPGGIHGGGYPPAKGRFYSALASDRTGVEMRVLQADSQSPATRQAVEAMLRGRPIDFLFIDGDHRYAGVARDFALWSPLVAPGGLIAFHDILKQVVAPDCEVDRFWQELRQSHVCTEIVAAPGQGWAGIGLLQLPIATPSVSACRS